MACSLVSDSMALLCGTQRRASVHADAPRFAGQKIIKGKFEFCRCIQVFVHVFRILLLHQHGTQMSFSRLWKRGPRKKSDENNLCLQHGYLPAKASAWRPRLRWLRYTQFRRLACLLRSSWHGTARQHTYVPVRMVWPVCIPVYILRTSCTYGFVSAEGDSTSIISLLGMVCSQRTVGGCLDGLIAIVKKWPRRVPSILHELLMIDGLLKLRCPRQLRLPVSLLAVHS